MDENITASPRGLCGVVVILEVVGGFMLLLMTIWTQKLRGGFAWHSDLKLLFNWHPLLMAIGMLFMYGNGMVVYRVLRHQRKVKLKVAHAILMIIVLMLTVVSLVAVFDSHNLADPPIANLYSLHSWFGLITVILFCFQWVSGFVAFLYPGIQRIWRAAYMPVHRFYGVVIFSSALVSAETGLLEKAHWVLKKNYQDLGSEAILVNLLGLTMAVFGVLVVYVTVRQDYQRRVVTEEEMRIEDVVIE